MLVTYRHTYRLLAIAVDFLAMPAAAAGPSDSPYRGEVRPAVAVASAPPAHLLSGSPDVAAGGAPVAEGEPPMQV